MVTYVIKIVLGTLIGCVLVQNSNANEYRQTQTTVAYTAYVNITYKDPSTGEVRTDVEESGYYGSSGRIDKEEGWVVHVKTEDGKNRGCSPPVNVPSGRWIALIARGDCTFQDKIYNSAIKSNASAVVIYNDKDEGIPVHMEHTDDVVSIFIYKSDGVKIVDLLDNGTKVYMHIAVGQKKVHNSLSGNINKTSVLFVSISFIVLMIISLAWLVFYYIQRFRYAHAKERLSKRLMHAARKAINKMSSRSIKAGDKETDQEFDPCAVCIENYKSGDVVRTLPCGHTFHKCCVDPWLIEHRSCPMCKLDILKAYGLQIHNSMDSLVNLDLEAASTSIGPSELLPPTSVLRAEPGVIEVVYYPNNLHRLVCPMDSRSEEEAERPSHEAEVSERVPEEKQALLARTDFVDGATGGVAEVGNTEQKVNVESATPGGNTKNNSNDCVSRTEQHSSLADIQNIEGTGISKSYQGQQQTRHDQTAITDASSINGNNDTNEKSKEEHICDNTLQSENNASGCSDNDLCNTSAGKVLCERVGASDEDKERTVMSETVKSLSSPLSLNKNNTQTVTVHEATTGESVS